jgi:catalase
MMDPPITGGAGKGWHEVFLKGSKEAESELITRRFAPEINRIQRDIQLIEDERHIKRAQHANMLAGTRNADFLVLTGIPDDLRVGLFQPGKHYQAHVRFSSASSIEQPDRVPDLRGVALRVKSDAGSDHDFLMTNAPFSHARDARQFMIVASAAARLGRPAALWRWRTW